MSSNHTNFARKYRPQHFDDVVGQKIICDTLKKSLETKRLPHAWLFSGPSGVGKTTCARILARCLNCLNHTEPTLTPCDQCESCLGIIAGESLDFVEIDGASNNSVDEVRQLREHIGFRPQQSRFRIILIDEVHMLSVAAFNALLKTLEEPPEHIKFIFATTEVDKVLPTVRARTQRFDFKLITKDELKDHIVEVAKKESISLEDHVADYLADYSSGSVRFGLTLLDQLGAKGVITMQDVREITGQALPQQVNQLCAYLWSQQSKEAILLIDQLRNEGVSLFVFMKQVLNYLRCSIEQKVGAVDHQIVIPQKINIQTLLYQSRLLLDLIQYGKKEEDVRTLLVLAAAKLSHEAPLIPIQELIEKVSQPNQSEELDVMTREEVIQVKDENVEVSAFSQDNNLNNDLLKKVVAKLEEGKKLTLATSLRDARFQIEKKEVNILLKSKFHFDLINDPDSQKAISSILKSITGENLKIKIKYDQLYERSEDESIPSDIETINDSSISSKLQKVKQMFDGELE